MTISFSGCLKLHNIPIKCSSSAGLNEENLQKRLKSIHAADNSDNNKVLINTYLNTNYITNLSENGIVIEHPLTGDELFFEFINKNTGNPAPLSKDDFNHLLTGFNAAKNSDTGVDLDFYS